MPQPMSWGATTGRERPEGGRWPANVVLDEDAAALVDAQSGERGGGFGVRGASTRIYGNGKGLTDATGEAVGYGDTGGASRFFYCAKASRSEHEAGLEGMPRGLATVGNMEAAGRDETNPANYVGGKQARVLAGLPPSVPRANHHPTVKPVALMRWLVRLVTPPGGLVLDPFMGSGTTGCAAALEGFRFLGFEREAEYVEIARSRIAHHAATLQPELSA